MPKQYEIVIKVDENDDDIVSETNVISEEDLNELKPLIESIKNFKTYKETLKSGLVRQYSHNYPMQDDYTEAGEKSTDELYAQVDEEIHELFVGLCPYCEYGFHTVKSIEITPYPVEGREKLL